MIERVGNIWDRYGKENTIVLITTNGFVKNNGKAVMGRGCAKEAAYKFPNFPAALGDHLRTNGNQWFAFQKGLWTFPVKHNWWEKADLLLIAKSASNLKDHAEIHPEVTFVLPRPGCGNGHLKWEQVKPLLESLPDNVEVYSK